MELQQERMKIDEYTREFYHLAIRSDYKWNKDIMIAFYEHGLNPQISLQLSISVLFTLSDTICVTHQIETGYFPKLST